MQKRFGDWPAEFWRFVIHTNQYAGNFENDLVAYWLYYKDSNLLENNNPIEDSKFDHIIRLPFGFEHDNSELFGFAHVWKTPCHILSKFTNEFDIKGSLVDAVIYNSVALFMDRAPTKDEESWFLERSKKFEKLYKNNLKILSLELIHMTIKQTSSKEWHLA